MSEQRKNRKRGILLAGVLILAIAALAALYFWLKANGYLEIFTSVEALQAYVRGFGAWAPAIFILLQIAQVIFAPIPGNVTRLAGGVALTCLLFSPLVTFDYDTYAAALQDYHVSVSTDGAVSDSSERLQRTVIESEMRTYILDKAAQCGAVLDDAQVTLQWSTDGYWYPQSVRLVTSGPAAENSRLAQIIEADLGIPRTRQEWSSTS